MKVLIMPVLAAVLFVAAREGDPTAVGPSATARFFDATMGITRSGGFATNEQFATSSALAVGQSECSTVDPGSTSFAFRSSEYGWYWVSGNGVAPLNDQSITAGGNFTEMATGNATGPTLFLLDNNFSVPRCS